MKSLAGTINYDVLVIGSGGAGCSAALKARQLGASVCLLTRSEFLDSKTSRAQGGIQAPLAKGDSADNLYEDALKAGERQNEKPLTRILADQAASTIEWLIEIGIKFDRDSDGKLLQRGAAGLSYDRVLSCGDASGNRIMQPLIKAVKSTDIDLYEYRTVENIEPEKGEWKVHSFDPRDGQEYVFNTKSVILATGGAMPKERQAGLEFIGNRLPPDSILLANRIGLNVENPELTQFHPTGILLPAPMRRRPIPELARSVGAKLLNVHNQVFVDSLLTRKKLCAAIVEECSIGNGVKTDDGRIGVWLDTPAIDREQDKGYTAHHFKNVYEKMLSHGHDMTTDMVLVYPIAHYTIGGIKIDVNCATNKAGIYAAGEATWGVHGNDRLMGNSLLEIFVFGRIAGEQAANRARNVT